MYHTGEAMTREQLSRGLSVGKLDLLEPEIRKSSKLRDPRLLETRIVIGIQIVDTDHVMASGGEAAGDVHADEPGGTRDENGTLQDISFPVAWYYSKRGRGRSIAARESSAKDAAACDAGCLHGRRRERQRRRRLDQFSADDRLATLPGHL
jgi:hypothetical protein